MKKGADVQERIKYYFSLAEGIFTEDKNLANRYVEIAREIAMKNRKKVPSSLKMHYCRNCYSYIRPGVNCSVRFKNGRRVFTCGECKHIMRFPYSTKT